MNSKPYARFVPGLQQWWIHSRNAIPVHAFGKTLEGAFEYYQRGLIDYEKYTRLP